MPPPARLALGWTEKTDWEAGLKRTIDWYLENGFSNYWEHGDVEVPPPPPRAPKGNAQCRHPSGYCLGGIWSGSAERITVWPWL